MYNFGQMQAAVFEKEKDLKATLYTIGVCGAVILLFFYIQWNAPQIPQPVTDTGIEVNLGNSETGFGDVAPQVPGEPANSNETNISTPPPSVSASAPSNQNINADENGDEEVNAATKNIKPTPTHKAVMSPVSANKRNSTQNTVAAKIPKPASPKALYKGGNGNGGNGADTYNNVRDQGIAGGHGDQGKPNGNPNSNNYNGNGGTGRSGMPEIRSGSGLDRRRIKSWPTFRDNFNEPAKVAVDVTVNASGKVISANVNPIGTTTPNRKIWNIATSKAKLLKFNAGSDDEQHGTIVFTFKVQQ